MTFIILLQALFATSFPICKYLLNFTSPLFLAGARFFIAGTILLTYQYFISSAFKIKRKDFWTFAQIIVLGIYVTQGLRLTALEVLPIWKASFLYNLSPFLSALYAYFLFKERLSTKQWFGLFLGIIGMIPILISKSPEEASLGELFYISIYELLLIVAVSLQSYSWLLIQRLVRYKKYKVSMVSSISMTGGGLLSLITSYAIAGPPEISDPITFGKGLMTMIFISNIICHNVYTGLLKKHSGTFMSFTSFLNPLFAALYGWAFFQEKISWHFYLSIIIVLTGLYVFYQDELKNKSHYEEKNIET